jgi:BlaI family transcriptional regulator, penicillinase repressor
MAPKPEYLTKREQQIMEIMYGRESATATEVQEALDNTLSNSSVRTHLRILEEKGHLTHQEAEGRFVYRPTRAKHSAAQSALQRVLQTFFAGSTEAAVATLLSAKEADLSEEELDRLSQMIERARKGGKA